MKTSLLSSLFLAALTAFGSVHAAGKGNEKCYSPADPSTNVNTNKPGTACYKQMQKVRKLEFDPRFDCSKEIRQKWQKEMDIASKMKCDT